MKVVSSRQVYKDITRQENCSITENGEDEPENPRCFTILINDNPDSMADDQREDPSGNSSSYNKNTKKCNNLKQ